MIDSSCNLLLFYRWDHSTNIQDSAQIVNTRPLSDHNPYLAKVLRGSFENVHYCWESYFLEEMCFAIGDDPCSSSSCSCRCTRQPLSFDNLMEVESSFVGHDIVARVHLYTCCADPRPPNHCHWSHEVDCGFLMTNAAVHLFSSATENCLNRYFGNVDDNSSFLRPFCLHDLQRGRVTVEEDRRTTMFCVIPMLREAIPDELPETKHNTCSGCRQL